MKEHLEEKAMKQYAEMLIEQIQNMEESNWEKPWIGQDASIWPQNINGRPYSGSNVFPLFLLTEASGYELPVFMTFNQTKEAGIQVQKGEKGFPVCHYHVKYKDENGEQITESEYNNMSREEQLRCKIIGYTNYYHVFNLDQTDIRTSQPEKWEALMNKLKGPRPEYFDENNMFKSPEIDKMLEEQSWVCKIKVQEQNSAYYHRANDEICVPLKKQFKSGELFYGTLLHEMTHSTGAEERLNRTKGKHFGDNAYAREELVAELGGALAAISYGISKGISEENKQYIKSWLDNMKEDPKFLMTVLTDACKAVRYIESYIPKMDLEEKMTQQADLKEDKEENAQEAVKTDEELDEEAYLTESGAIDEGRQAYWIASWTEEEANSGQFYEVWLKDEEVDKREEQLKYKNIPLYNINEAKANDNGFNIIDTFYHTEQIEAAWDTLFAKLQPAEVKQDTVNTEVKEYSYRMTIRPFSIGTQPDGFLRHEDDGSRYGAVVYDHPLSREEAENYSLRPLTEARELSGKSFEFPLGPEKLTCKVLGVDDDGMIQLEVNGKQEYYMTYYQFQDEIGKDAKETTAELTSSQKAQTYYASVAYLQSADDTILFERLMENGDYVRLLQEAAEYDQGEAIDQENTWKKACVNTGDDVIDENEHYAVVYNNSVGGTYDVLRKVTKDDIEQSIQRYGLQSSATEDVKAVAREMVENELKARSKEQVSGILLPNNEMLLFEYNARNDALEFGKPDRDTLHVLHTIPYEHELSLEDNIKNAQAEISSLLEEQAKASMLEQMDKGNVPETFEMPNGRILYWGYNTDEHNFYVGQLQETHKMNIEYTYPCNLYKSLSENLDEIRENLMSKEENTKKEVSVPVDYNIKNIHESSIDKLREGKTTLRETAEELHRAGHFNYIPSDEQVIEHLNHYLQGTNEKPLDLDELRQRDGQKLQSVLDRVKIYIDHTLQGKENDDNLTELIAQLSDNELQEAKKYSEKKSGRSKVTKVNIGAIRREIGHEIQSRTNDRDPDRARENAYQTTMKQFSINDLSDFDFNKHISNHLRLFSEAQEAGKAGEAACQEGVLQATYEMQEIYANIIVDRKNMQNLITTKLKHPDCLLFYKVADTYRLYGEDAQNMSKICNLPLIQRGPGAMTQEQAEAKSYKVVEFQRQDLDKYLPMTIRAGHRVAILSDDIYKNQIHKDNDKKKEEPAGQLPEETTEEEKEEKEKSLICTFNGAGLDIREEGDEKPTASISTDRKLTIADGKVFTSQNRKEIQFLLTQGNGVLDSSDGHKQLVFDPLNEPTKIYEHPETMRRHFLSVETVNSQRYASEGRTILAEGDEIDKLLDNTPEVRASLEAKADKLLENSIEKVRNAYLSGDKKQIYEASVSYIQASKYKYQNEYSPADTKKELEAIANSINHKKKKDMEENNQEKKELKDGISVFKMNNGMYGINETVNGVRSKTRLLSPEDTHAYFDGLKGQPKEEIERRRVLLADKYLHQPEQNRQVGETAKKQLEPLGQETRERLSDASVFKMQDGASYGVRTKIDGEQYSAKRVHKEDIAAFFDGYKGLPKEEQEERKTQLAAMYFKEELNTPKQEQEQSRGMHR